MAKTKKGSKATEPPPPTILAEKDETTTKERISDQLANIRARNNSSSKIIKKSNKKNKSKNIEKAMAIKERVEAKTLKSLERKEKQKSRKEVWE